MDSFADRDGPANLSGDGKTPKSRVIKSAVNDSLLFDTTIVTWLCLW